MVRAAFDMSPDIVVLISGDSDFVPVVLELRSKGIRVEVASFGNAMSSLLRHRCSDYINLDALSGEPTDWPDGDWYRETGENEPEEEPQFPTEEVPLEVVEESEVMQDGFGLPNAR